MLETYLAIIVCTTLPICTALIVFAVMRWWYDSARHSIKHATGFAIGLACIIADVIITIGDAGRFKLAVSIGTLALATTVLTGYVYKAIKRRES